MKLLTVFLFKKSRLCLKKPLRSDGYHEVLVEKDRQLNDVLFEKGRYPRIQLIDISMTRVVLHNFEKLDISRANLSGCSCTPRLLTGWQPTPLPLADQRSSWSWTRLSLG